LDDQKKTKKKQFEGLARFRNNDAGWREFKKKKRNLSFFSLSVGQSRDSKMDSASTAKSDGGPLLFNKKNIILLDQNDSMDHITHDIIWTCKNEKVTIPTSVANLSLLLRKAAESDAGLNDVSTHVENKIDGRILKLVIRFCTLGHNVGVFSKEHKTGFFENDVFKKFADDPDDRIVHLNAMVSSSPELLRFLNEIAVTPILLLECAQICSFLDIRDAYRAFRYKFASACRGNSLPMNEKFFMQKGTPEMYANLERVLSLEFHTRFERTGKKVIVLEPFQSSLSCPSMHSNNNNAKDAEQMQALTQRIEAHEQTLVIKDPIKNKPPTVQELKLALSKIL
jgi:hypothetical protein